MKSISIQKLREAYEDQGIVYLKDFLDPRELKSICDDLTVAEAFAITDLTANWNGDKVAFFSKNPVRSVDTGQTEDFVVTPYFQASTNTVHIFFEEIEGQLVLNRLGHGLHLRSDLRELQRLVYENPDLRELLNGLGYKSPICLLSVYIPKLPYGFGSEVRPHQESTFAHTDPLSACVLWVALEDASIENACMYGIPGSHRLPLKFISNVDHEGKRRTYIQVNDTEIPDFDPARPHPYIPLEVKAGDALLFHGNFVHCSPRNTSTRSRKALSFQFVETENTRFSSFNWIKSPNAKQLNG